MSQEKIKFNNYIPPNPDNDGYTASIATTSTPNSGRTMRGYMNNVPLFSTESYNLKWTNISANDASKILKEVVNKAGFMFNHYNLYSGKWENKRFYAANFNSPFISLKDGVEKVKQLSFQVTGEAPIWEQYLQNFKK